MKYLLSLVLLCACGAETSLQGSTLAQVGKSDTTSDVGQDSGNSVETQTSEKDVVSGDTLIPPAPDGTLDSVDVGVSNTDMSASPDVGVTPDAPNVPPDVSPDAGADTDDTGTVDPDTAPDLGQDKDSDQDGLLDSQEAVYGTNPYNPDTDKDGLSDGVEVASWKTNPLSVDTDKDGLPDGLEAGKVEDADKQSTTDPNNPDTDGDGVLDGFEDKNKNGKVDTGEADPANPSDLGMPPKPVVDLCEGKICDDGNVCTQDSCQKGVCSHVPVPGVCDDGDTNTKDSCQDGVCKGVWSLCSGYTVIPAGVLPANTSWKVPQTPITKFWVDKRAVLGSEYKDCIKAGACPPLAWGTSPIPYGGVCQAPVCSGSLTSGGGVSTNNWDTIEMCKDSKCLCSPIDDEPVTANLSMASAFCDWRGGRVISIAEQLWAGGWNGQSYSLACSVGQDIPNLPSKAFNKIVTCGLLNFPARGSTVSCSGTGEYGPPIATWKPFTPVSSGTPPMLVSQPDPQQGGRIQCAYDTKPSCP